MDFVFADNATPHLKTMLLCKHNFCKPWQTKITFDSLYFDIHFTPVVGTEPVVSSRCACTDRKGTKSGSVRFWQAGAGCQIDI